MLSSLSFPGCNYPQNTNPFRETFVEITLKNHQNYNITVVKDSKNLKCTVEKHGIVYSNVKLLIASNANSSLSMGSPYSYTFYSEKCIVVFGPYGLKGGMKMSDTDGEENNKPDNDDDKNNESKISIVTALEVAGYAWSIISGIILIGSIILNKGKVNPDAVKNHFS